jgi:hypothetical protein
MKDGGLGRTLAVIVLAAITVPRSAAARSPACDAVTIPPAAVYLPEDAPTNAVFSGNVFLIDGNDRNLDVSRRHARGQTISCCKAVTAAIDGARALRDGRPCDSSASCRLG